MNKYTIVRIIKIVLIGIVSAMFLMSAYGKLTSAPMAVQMLDTLHLEGFRVALGWIEIVIVLALIWRPTRNIAVLIGTAYLGAAIASEFMLGANGLIPGLTMLGLWIIQKLNWLSMKHGNTCGCGICTNCSDCKDNICKLHSDKKCDCPDDGTCMH